MSSFLSNKFLQQRSAGRRPVTTIAEDRFCTSCGYNVRGLNMGRNCPECGTAVTGAAESVDFLLSGEWSARRTVQWGLTFIIAAALGAMALKLVSFNWLVFANASAPIAAFRWIDVLAGAVWALGVWLVTPRRMETASPQLRYPRLAARWLQWCWPVAGAVNAYAAAQIASGGSADGLLTLRWLAQFAAWGGALCAMYLLTRLADEADLEIAYNRIGLAMWLVPLPTVVLAMIPDEVAWIALFLIGPVVLLWCWCLILLARGVLVMQRHASWAMRIAVDAPNRAARQMETRKELDAAVAAQVRPIAPAKPDVPVETHPQAGSQPRTPSK